MSHDSRFLTIKEAAAYLGLTVRWMRRNYVALIRAGVSGYRVPRGAPRGRLMLNKRDLDRYMAQCRVNIAGNQMMETTSG
jgi:hypothetical protein